MSGKLSRTNFEIPANTVEELKVLFETDISKVFTIPEFRQAFTLMRLDQISPEAIEVAKEVDQGAIENVVEYNLQMLKNIRQHMQTLRRPAELIKPLMCIQHISLHAENMKVLCIGPRTEIEFFEFIGHGFKAGNLTGLDLMSYSEFVDVGDMHDMPYEKNTFDIVFVGWTLTYSKDIQKVADECRRVAKPGGYIAIGVESNGLEDRGSLQNFKLTDAINIRETQEIIDLFDGHIHSVPFRHEVHRSMKKNIDMVMVVIELK